jgi:hypothetical protein
VETVLPFFRTSYMIGSGGMKQSKFTTRDGVVMLLGIALVLIVMMWLILSGIVPTHH